MSEIANFLSEYQVSDNLIFEKEHEIVEYNPPIGMIVEETNGRKMILSNGDDGQWGLVEEYSKGTISFKCLGRFFNNGNEPTIKLMKEIASKIAVIYITAEAYSSNPKDKKPGPGYVWLTNSRQWHRSPIVLFVVPDTLKNRLPDNLDIHENYLYILMGVDDDQYFGTLFQSPILIENQDQAFDALKPLHIRKVAPENIRRQGEWFFIRIEDNPMTFEGAEHIPRINNADHGNYHHYPLRSRNDNPESNTHLVLCQDLYFVDDTFDINDGKKIPIFGDNGDVCVNHNEHPELNLLCDNKYWWWAIENTALLSYSEMGVD